MLLNVSNHPVATWPTSQFKTATDQFGKVTDLEFPHIDPMWSEQKVDSEAMSLLAKIQLINPDAVHLMGELTFCFRLVNMLKSKGYFVLASTTMRETIIDEKGRKISTFNFVKFRSY